MYEVIVGNIGSVTKTEDYDLALRNYNDCIERSIYHQGRAAGEDVFIIDSGGNEIKEFYGDRYYERGI